MAFKGINQNSTTRTLGAVANTSAEERPAAQFWGNVGYFFEDPESGDKTFLAGYGFPIDQATRRRGNGDMEREKEAFRADFLESIQSFEPGQEAYEPIGDTGLFLQIRRVKEAETTERGAAMASARPRLNFGSAA